MYVRIPLPENKPMPATGTNPRQIAAPGPVARTVNRLPPTSFFLTSAVFHYLGPSLAALLFVHVAALGVAWLRITCAAIVFALWRRPWRIFKTASHSQRLVFVGLGVVLAAMNTLFYLAIARLPLATVGAIEFLGTVILAAAGARTRRNVLALVLAAGGVAVLSSVQLAGQPLGLVFAFANCAGFMIYIMLGHHIANTTASGGDSSGLPLSGIDQLGLSMLIAAVAATPLGLAPAIPAFTHPVWLLWGIGVGVCSSVIPYVTDQLAMARLPRATFSLMLALLPATATVIGLIVLGQVPTARDLAGIALVILGIALHRDPPNANKNPRQPGQLPGKLISRSANKPQDRRGMRLHDLRHTGNAFAAAQRRGPSGSHGADGSDSERAAIIYQSLCCAVLAAPGRDVACPDVKQAR
jgi:inner membrane transporter RhtA